MPPLRCQILPSFDPENRDSLLAAFAGISPIEMGQAWLAAPDPDFLAAEVRVGRRGNSLIVSATMPDLDIFTKTTDANQRTWELGDVFEMFLKPEGEVFYRELHITPANTRTQLAIAAEGATGEFLPDGIFASHVWIESGHWQVFAAIPSEVVTGREEISPGEKWRFSFCRYDAFQDGRQPILSSTSPHPVPKFHRPAEWGVMVFD
jgi:hypothetical protein